MTPLEQSDGHSSHDQAVEMRDPEDLASPLLGLVASCLAAPDLGAIHRAATRAAARLTDSSQSSLRVLDPTGRRLHVTARQGPAMHKTGTSRFAASEGFQGWVCRHAKPALTNDPPRDPRFEARRGQKWMPTALGAVPLVGRNGVVGVLAIAREDGIPYTTRDLEHLQLVAAIALPHIETLRLVQVTLTDPLTGLLNRRALQRSFGAALATAASSGGVLSSILLDLDHFHDVNSAHGLDAGDDVLVGIAKRLREVCREEDAIFRWGGEEFLVLLPGLAIEEVSSVAERLRAHIAEQPFETRRDSVPVTASMAAATAAPGEAEEAFFLRLDQAMKSAKNKGRNIVEVARHDP